MNLDIVKNWYGKTTPKRFDVENLLSFVYKSDEFLTILPSKKVLKLKIKNTKEIAYTDGEDCVISTMLFDPGFYRQYVNINEHDSILACLGLVNALQIHESLHIQLLPTTNLAVLIKEHAKKEQNKNLSQNKLFQAIYNVVEDEYSEFWFSVKEPYYNEFLVFARSLLFSYEAFETALMKYQSENSPYDRINLLTCYRNHENDDSLVWEKDELYEECVNLLYSVHNIHLSINERLEIAHKIFKKLITPSEQKDEAYTTPISQSGIDSVGVGTFFDVFIEKYKFSERTQDRIESKANKIQVKSSKDSEFDIKIVYKDVETSSGETLDGNNLFSRFSEMVKYAKARKTAHTMPKDRGSRIDANLLHRILIDNKIFRVKNGTKNKRSEPEIIILIDWSGSMCSESLNVKVANATYSIFKSLHENGVSASVYAHTSKNERYDEYCLIYGVAANKMPFNGEKDVTTRDYEKRFQSLLTKLCSQNADGFAIQYCSTKFSDREDTKKVLLVLSDGQPAFPPNYWGDDAEYHVQKIVGILRESNISVLSLSLTKDVMSENNRIYGNEHNVAAYGTDFEKNFRKTIYQIMKKES